MTLRLPIHLPPRFFLATVACCCLLLVPSSWAGEFTVSPVRLELGAGMRSGAIVVRNEGNEKLGFQLQALEWRQDAAGQDQYSETRDLIFFPRMMTVEPGQEGLVRVGTRRPAGQTEKTYRLFIEELPGPTAAPPDQSTAQVTFLIRFGAPIFVSPLQPQDDLAIESLAMAEGEISLSARNSGNRHQIVRGVHLKGLDAQGNQVYARTLADRYLLSGAAKNFSAAVPPADCARLASLTVEFTTDKTSTSRKLDVLRSMCP